MSLLIFIGMGPSAVVRAEEGQGKGISIGIYYRTRYPLV